jgi:hypothetical protein
LTAEERGALAVLTNAKGAQRATLGARHARGVLARFARPLTDVAGLHSKSPAVAARWILPVIYRAMHREQTTFWDWPATSWLNLICADHRAFTAANCGLVPTEGRAIIRTAAYLFGGLTDLRPVGMSGVATPMARGVCVPGPGAAPDCL